MVTGRLQPGSRQVGPACGVDVDESRSSPYIRTHVDHGMCYCLASYDVHQTWWYLRREGHASWGIREVKVRYFVGTQKMEAGVAGEGIGELKTAGIRGLDSVVADIQWKSVAAVGLARYCLVPRMGIGLGQGTWHRMVWIVVEMLGSEVGFAAMR